MFIRSLSEGFCSNWPLLANVFTARIAVRAKNSMLTAIDHRPNEWLAFLGSFRERRGRVEPLHAFRLAEASQVRRGDRTNWALINGYSIEPGEAFFESIGRPGLFSWQNGRTERVLRGLRVRLVDFSFLVKHTSAGRGSTGGKVGLR